MVYTTACKMQAGDEFEWDKDNEEKLAARHGVDR